MNPSEPAITFLTFTQTVEEALKLVRNADRLGRESPLAAAYLLANYLEKEDNSADARGIKLRRLMDKAIGKITGPYGERYQTILREQYLNGKRIDDVLLDDRVYLSLNSRAVYHRNRKEAIAELARILTEMLNPALRLEVPLRVERKLFSREKEIDHCWQALQDGQAITLTGESGVGKTTLGSHLAHLWGQPSVFWFTIRPGFNDHIQNLAFALGYFFKTLNEPTLWQEMMTQTTAASDHLAHLIRYSLQNLHKSHIRPLLCFDEVDLLRPTQESKHTQLIALLDNLRGQVPMLLIGQQSLLDPQPFCILEDLTLSATTQMLEEANIRLLPAEIQRIHSYTNGNPRLIELVITLFAYGVSRAELFQEIDIAPPLEFFLSKIALRMEPNEVALLNALAVFRNPAPVDFWQKHSELGLALNQLLQRRLIVADDHGGIVILAAYRNILYRLLPVEARQALHETAAAIWTTRAAHTSAAYHLIEAGQSELAVLQWYQHRQQEINQGQASAAYELFHKLEPQSLSPLARQQHGLTCAELARLVGNDQQALKDIHSVVWSAPVLGINAYIQEGMIANDAHEFTEARHKFVQALAMAENLIEIQLAYIHKGLSWAHFSEKDLQIAWQESQRARYEVEYMQGLIQIEMASYSQAAQFLQSALLLAQAIGYKDGIAKAANSLSVVLGMQGKYQQVEEYAIIAAEMYETLGKSQAVCRIKVNLAMSYNLAGEHEKALAALHEAEALVLSHKYPLPMQYQLYINLGFAETYLGQRDWSNAEKSILSVIKSEETKFMADAYRVMGDILLGRGEWITAEQWIQQAIEMTDREENGNLYIGGYAWRSLASIYAKTGKFQEAKAAKVRAIEIFTEIHLPHEVEKTMALTELPPEK